MDIPLERETLNTVRDRFNIFKPTMVHQVDQLGNKIDKIEESDASIKYKNKTSQDSNVYLQYKLNEVVGSIDQIIETIEVTNGDMINMQYCEIFMGI